MNHVYCEINRKRNILFTSLKLNIVRICRLKFQIYSSDGDLFGGDFFINIFLTYHFCFILFFPMILLKTLKIYINPTWHYYFYVGDGKFCWQFMIAFPQSRGHVINFSKKLLISFTNLKIASKGCACTR